MEHRHGQQAGSLGSAPEFVLAGQPWKPESIGGELQFRLGSTERFLTDVLWCAFWTYAQTVWFVFDTFGLRVKDEPMPLSCSPPSRRSPRQFGYAVARPTSFGLTRQSSASGVPPCTTTSPPTARWHPPRGRRPRAGGVAQIRWPESYRSPRAVRASMRFFTLRGLSPHFPCLAASAPARRGQLWAELARGKPP